MTSACLRGPATDVIARALLRAGRARSRPSPAQRRIRRVRRGSREAFMLLLARGSGARPTLPTLLSTRLAAASHAFRVRFRTPRSSTMVRVRPAGLGDVATLVSLHRRELLLDARHATRPCDRRSLRRWHEAQVVERGHRTLVATVHDLERREHLLGFLSGENDPRVSAPRARLTELLVRRDVRRCGIATQLLGELVEQLARDGHLVAEAAVDHDSATVDGLFGRLGWCRADAGSSGAGSLRRVCLDIAARPAQRSEGPA